MALEWQKICGNVTLGLGAAAIRLYKLIYFKIAIVLSTYFSEPIGNITACMNQIPVQTSSRSNIEPTAAANCSNLHNI
jgi:hypothetical protein